MKVGVLALQGDAREHLRMLAEAGAHPTPVKRPDELADVDALVLPGGESTTIGKLLARSGLLDPIRSRTDAGMPLFGTCAGLILMAREVVGREKVPHSLALLDVAVERNAYGRQADSFETDLTVEGIDRPVRAAFIRAPAITKTGEGVEVLARVDDRPVLVRRGPLLGATFHPEICGDPALHGLFVSMLEA